jgi:hypothetical protein
MRPIEAPPPTADGPRILVPGEPVADAPLVDQQGKARPFRDVHRPSRGGHVYLHALPAARDSVR